MTWKAPSITEYVTKATKKFWEETFSGIEESLTLVTALKKEFQTFAETSKATEESKKAEEEEVTRGANVPYVVPSVSPNPVELRQGKSRLVLKGATFNMINDRVAQAGEAKKQYEKRKAIFEAFKSYGGNCVRLRVLYYEYEHLEYHSSKTEYVKEVKEVCKTAKELGLTVCITPWDATDNPTYEGKKWAESGALLNPLWKALTEELNSYENVFYDLVNEPHEVTWAQWTPLVEAYLKYFREACMYKGVIAVEPINYSNSGISNGTGVSEGYNIIEWRKIMAYDATLPHLANKHQILICKHDYYYDHGGAWEQEAWEKQTFGPSRNNIDVAIWWNEVGNYVNSGEAESKELNAAWSVTASRNAASYYSGHPAFVGYAFYIWGWTAEDKNRITAASSESGEFLTLTSPWGTDVKLALEGAMAVEEKEKEEKSEEGKSKVPNFLIGTNGGASWGETAGKNIVKINIPSVRVETIPSQEYEGEVAYKSGFTNPVFIVGNVSDGEALSSVNLSSWVSKTYGEIKKVLEWKEKWGSMFPNGEVLCEVGNEMYAKGGSFSIEQTEANAPKYAEMFISLHNKLVTESKRTQVKLLYNTGTVYGTKWIEKGAAVTVTSNKLATSGVVDGFTHHPYGALTGEGLSSLETEHGHCVSASIARADTFYLTEYGYAYPGSEGIESNQYATSEANQISIVKQCYEKFKALSYVRGVWWYNAHDNAGNEKWGLYKGRSGAEAESQFRAVAYTVASF